MVDKTEESSSSISLKSTKKYLLLIIIFFSIVIIAGFLWGITKPALEQYSEKSATIDEIQNNQPQP